MVMEGGRVMVMGGGGRVMVTEGGGGAEGHGEACICMNAMCRWGTEGFYQ